MPKSSKTTKSAKDKKSKKVKPHYVCTGGCKTVSEVPIRCTFPNCYRNKNPLTECKCTDKKHGDLYYRNAPKDEDGNPLPFRNILRGIEKDSKDVIDS